MPTRTPTPAPTPTHLYLYLYPCLYRAAVYANSPLPIDFRIMRFRPLTCSVHVMAWLLLRLLLLLLLLLLTCSVHVSFVNVDAYFNPCSHTECRVTRTLRRYIHIPCIRVNEGLAWTHTLAGVCASEACLPEAMEPPTLPYPYPYP